MTLTDTTCPSAFVCFGADNVDDAASISSNHSHSDTEVAAVSTATNEIVRNVTNNNNSVWVARSDVVAGVGKTTLTDKTAKDASAAGDEFSFPRRVPVDLEFENVRYTVGRLSVSQRKYGKIDCKSI